MPSLHVNRFGVALTTGLLACGGDKGSVDTASANPLSQLTSAVSSIEKMSNSMAATANRKPVRQSAIRCCSIICRGASMG